ncbi:flagellar basal body-associated FliL family protein [Candidatus Symbiobacter mobilis]|uniref:Flagellar protein FliL n=1 Tax=Candidatus Symbiobacter mobilis CR TaxID=946483 RepID=U5NAG6_9BURK|nr:flagellar basal body-associated FliL family protein [Candidatus Symbiobacter mobilis]AGX88367.1 flagellar protein FliL [Candidatus Symbiobacter mobilis CR]
MATKHAEADAAAPPQAKNKKKLFLIVGIAVLVIAIGAGAAVMMMKGKGKKTEGKEGEHAAAPAATDHAPAHEEPEPEPEPEPEAAHAATPKTPPVYLPLDNMVVNLADPGGERVAQIGIIFEVLDAKAVDTVKAYLPAIRSGILLLLSQRTAEQLLSPDGKQKLMDDILREASIPFGGSYDDEEDETKPKKRKKRKPIVIYPVTGVHFSSLIVQ